MTRKPFVSVVLWSVILSNCTPAPLRPGLSSASPHEGDLKKESDEERKMSHTEIDSMSNDSKDTDSNSENPETPGAGDSLESPDGKPSQMESGIPKYSLIVPLPFENVPKPAVAPTNSPEAIGRELLVYRLAMAANLDFQKGKTIDQSISEIKSFVTNMNLIYHRDLAIEFELVSEELEKKLMFTPANDPFDPKANPSYLNFPALNQFIDRIAGPSNFDIGHTLVYNPPDGAGWGNLSPCQASKSNGTSFSFSALVHEVGHQFSAPHSCYVEGGEYLRNTIMCRGGDNSDYFHQASLESIIEYSRRGVGSRCGVRKPVANTPPRPYLGFRDGITIPAQTAFSLIGGAIDTEDQANLTYNWQQIDTNIPKDGSKYDNPNAAFRSFFPTAQGYVRYLPNLPDLLAGKETPGEILSKVSRSYNFSMVVRDNNKLAGGVDWIKAKVNVEGSAGPFMVTEPVTPATWKVGSKQMIKWDVAGTDKAPIQTSKVNILISLDDGATFRLAAADVANSGIYELQVPKLLTSKGRIMIQAVDNIYFAVSTQGKVTIEE
jgi:hypothetical protein